MFIFLRKLVKNRMTNNFIHTKFFEAKEKEDQGLLYAKMQRAYPHSGRSGVAFVSSEQEKGNIILYVTSTVTSMNLDPRKHAVAITGKEHEIENAKSKIEMITEMKLIES